jgi:phosphatidylglycerol:prolipoprotein diacylglycerol transferase
LLPINLKIFSNSIENYEGIYFFIAIVLGIVYFSYLCKLEKINLEVMYEAIAIGLITALVTGRLLSFLLWNPKTLISDPFVFFKPWQGGITVAGGVFGGLIAGAIYAKVRRLSFFYHMRFFLPSILIGQIVGRFGCFLNGDAVGKPTSSIFGMVFHPDSIAYSNAATHFSSKLAVPGTHLHPAQLYDIFGNLIVFIFILITWNNDWIKKRMICWYAMGTCATRFIVEFFRNDTEKWFSIFTTGQQICVVGFLIGLVILIYSFFNKEAFDTKEENIARIKVDKYGKKKK